VRVGFLFYLLNKFFGFNDEALMSTLADNINAIV
jgi:hypothetical protein